ncbi:hypothetical protein O3M35_011147 [Rhynocoris fuscipes]|uniref:Uncharacterized protein n=1 Tax=Rhynocoris fuscipes TaxID=488301 RepID=A0AAW1CVK4_9HEMI
MEALLFVFLEAVVVVVIVAVHSNIAAVVVVVVVIIRTAISNRPLRLFVAWVYVSILLQVVSSAVDDDEEGNLRTSEVYMNDGQDVVELSLLLCLLSIYCCCCIAESFVTLPGFKFDTCVRGGDADEEEVSGFIGGEVEVCGVVEFISVSLL